MTRPARPAPRRLALAAATAVGAVLLLAGCGTQVLAGSAAVVGDQRLTDAQVATSADEVTTALRGRSAPADPAELNRTLIAQWVTSSLLSVAAAREGITITPTEVAATRTAIDKSIGGAENMPQYAAERSVPPTGVNGAILASLQYAALGKKLAPGGDEQAQAGAANQYLGALSKDLGTEVSPRFGTWDPTRVTVGLPPQDLSRPATEAAATPTPQAS